MAENKMEQIAAMFGKKLGEEFKIKEVFSGRVWIVKFTSNGLKENFFMSEWLLSGELLQMLLVGRAVIVDD